MRLTSKLMLVLAFCFSFTVTALSAAPAYVTGNAKGCTATSCAVSLTSTNGGDLMVLGLFVLNSTSVSSVIDTQGNQYVLIGSQTWSPNGFVERLYYAKNIKGGADTATVTLSGSTTLEVFVYEYSGLDTSAPLDISATPHTGTSVTGTSGVLATANANDLLFALFHPDNDVTTAAGSGFTGRVLLGSILLAEDQNVTSTGSYSATMGFSGNADYVGFLVAFKAAASGGGSLSISGVTVSPTATTAVVSWTTNSSANSRVDYGTTTAYGSNGSDSTLVTSHSLTLNSLTCGTTYHYEITSVGSAGSASTADATFATSACASGGTPAYVGGNAKGCTATSCAVSLTSTNGGDLMVLGLFVLNSTSVSSVIDTQGNQYVLIGSQTWSPNGFVERLYYAKNIKGGADTATVTLSGSTTLEVFVYEYSGLDTSAPLDISATPHTGTSVTGTSGVLATANANDLLFALFHPDNDVTTAAGSGFTGRVLLGSILLAEDQNVTSTGSYSATMGFSGNADYVGFLVAFKAAASGGGSLSISGVTVSPTATTAVVSWTTNSSANSRVDYGTTTAYGSNGSDSTLVTSHSLTLNSLTCGTTYHYEITSVGSAGSASTADATFATSACASGGTPAYVGGNAKGCTATSCAVSLTSTNGGDLMVLGLFVLNSTSVSSVIDTQGNQYVLIGSQTWSPNGFVERLYYAKNIKGGADTATVTLSGSTTLEVFVYEYSGLDTSAPLDISATPHTGTSVTGTSGVLATANANDLLFALFHPDNDVTTAAGSGFTGRVLLGSILLAEDQNVTSTGSYSATMGFSGNADYVGFLVAFRAVASGGGSLSISGVTVSPTATTAVVSWTTNSSANSRVDYGTTTAYGSNGSDSTLVTSHSLTLNSLTCGTTYHYEITSVGSAGSASTADATFATSACATISGVSVSPTATTAIVSWTTSVSANSRVDYGTTTAYGSNVSDSTLVTSHSLTLNSLTCGTTYHYEITSVGSAGSTSTADATFTTSACGGPVSDDFHSILNPMWTFHAPCCGFVKMNGTDAILVVPGVTPHFTVGLLQNIADMDFQVEVKFDSLVTQGDQTEGILVQQDAQNFIWFGVYHDGKTPRLYAVVEIGGTPSVVYDNPITIAVGSTSFWMRVKRAGTAWTQSWSTDGATYNSAILTQSLTVSAIGPAAGNDHDSSNDPAPNFMAAVDYFFNSASPISPTDGGLPQPPNQPVFNIWYGDSQTFGQWGISQQWVNILGNVSAPSGIASASYTLNPANGGQPQFLRVGPNGTRLVDTGDFNVEIDHTILSPGANTVVITATDNLNNTTTHTVTVNWANTGQVWQLPYSIDWSMATNISDVAQVVDGQWALQPDGTVRSTQAGYDRLIAFGDVTWTDYVVTAELTFNTVDCVDFGAGIVVGWTGHTYGDPLALSPDQPRTGHPFFGQAGYGTPGTLKIYANSPNYPETTLAQDTSGLKLALGVKYMMKFAVQRTSSTTSEYYLKVWPSSATEPSSWNLQAQGDASTGAALIGTGAADVSFGKITVAAFP